MRSELVAEYRKAYENDLFRGGVEPQGASLYSPSDAWAYVRDVEAHCVKLRDSTGAFVKRRGCRGIWAEFECQQAIQTLLYDVSYVQRSGEAARLLVGHISPSPLKWAVKAGTGEVPAVSDVQISPSGVKTRQYRLCGNLQLETDLDGLAMGFLRRLPATLQFYEDHGVTVTAATPVFIRLGGSGWGLHKELLPEDYGCRYRRMCKFRNVGNVGVRATPHSSRNSGLTQDNADKVPVDVSKRRALIERDTTLGGYQSLSRSRRGTAPMRERGALSDTLRTSAWQQTARWGAAGRIMGAVKGYVEKHESDTGGFAYGAALALRASGLTEW